LLVHSALVIAQTTTGTSRATSRTRNRTVRKVFIAWSYRGALAMSTVCWPAAAQAGRTIGRPGDKDKRVAAPPAARAFPSLRGVPVAPERVFQNERGDPAPPERVFQNERGDPAPPERVFQNERGDPAPPERVFQNERGDPAPPERVFQKKTRDPAILGNQSARGLLLAMTTTHTRRKGMAKSSKLSKQAASRLAVTTTVKLGGDSWGADCRRPACEAVSRRSGQV
jgi:hypothetical protein